MPPHYDLVVALNYYAPYVSGVTEAARVTAEGLAERGLRVLVVCGRHDESSPAKETINGVDVVRTQVLARIGKGIVSPSYVPTVAYWARRAKAVHVHAPMLEAGAIAVAIRGRTPLVVTYHCDVDLPEGAFNRIQVAALDASHRLALRQARRVVVTSLDYASSSRLARALGTGRTTEIPPPSLLRAGGAPTYREGDGLHVGFLGRIVEEKGLEYLVAGFRELGPQARLLIGGDFAAVAGGSVVDRVRAAIGDDPRVRLLGFVPDDRLADFYASLDVFALPSVNSLEAFGIAQVEAMMLGIPSLASDLPGVRLPVRRTGFGLIVPVRDARAITEGLTELAQGTLDRAAGAADTRRSYGAEGVVAAYTALFDDLLTSGR